jgi:S1-C subfamily serine protease
MLNRHGYFVAILALIASVSTAEAETEQVIWTQGGWTVAVMERAGRQVGCHTYVDYQAGTRFVLMLARTGEWSGALGEHGALPNLQPGLVRLVVDGHLVFDGRAAPFWAGGIKFVALEEQTIQALSNGYSLNVLTPSSGSRKLDLSGLEDALAVVRNCTAAINEGRDPAASAMEQATRHADAPSPSDPRPTGPQIVTGTAFLVSDRSFLTNAHVTSSCRTLGIAQPGHSDWTSASLLASDATNDLALIHAASWTTSAVAPSLRGQVRLGESVAVFGYPYGGAISASGSFTQGSVSSLTGLGDNSGQLTITAPIQPGNSGGPVLDQYGRVVGVVVAKLDPLKMAKLTGDMPEGINFAIKASTAISFLEANGVAPGGEDVHAADRVIPAPDLADRAASITVMVRCEK